MTHEDVEGLSHGGDFKSSVALRGKGSHGSEG